MNQVAWVKGSHVFFEGEGVWASFPDEETAKAVLRSVGLVSLSQAYPEMESSEKENIFLR